MLGFHGCDRSVAERVVSGADVLKNSTNDYDWLGSGIYFWEQNPARALEYAGLLKMHPERTKGALIKEPAVIGAVLDLGHCFDLLEQRSLDLLAEAHRSLEKALETVSKPMPANRAVKGKNDLLLRNLDCAVMEYMHAVRSEQKEERFDSVRAVFPEGAALYPNAGFRDHSHIQLCIRNPNCIKGFFHVRTRDLRFKLP
jgi:hypothetical protein